MSRLKRGGRHRGGKRDASGTAAFGNRAASCFFSDIHLSADTAFFFSVFARQRTKTCCVADIENSFAGLQPSRHRAHYPEMRLGGRKAIAESFRNDDESMTSRRRGAN